MSPATSPSLEAELTDTWVALEPGADPAEHARMLRRAHETFTEAGTVPRPVRSVGAGAGGVGWCRGGGGAPREPVWGPTARRPSSSWTVTWAPTGPSIRWRR